MMSKTVGDRGFSGKSDLHSRDGMTSAPKDTGSFAPRCLSLDLEVGVRDRRIRAFAALRPDTGGRLVFRGGDLTAALAELDSLAGGAAFLLGHNLIAFDLPQLKAAKPGLRLLNLPAVDTPVSYTHLTLPTKRIV